MPDSHRNWWLPLSDAHLVSGLEWAYAANAVECRSDTSIIGTREPDAHRIGHPIDVVFDWFDNFPNVRGACGDVDCHM